MSEFQINTYTNYYQNDPSVTSLADGGYVVTWDGYGQDGFGVIGQIFNADGSQRGSEFLLAEDRSDPKISDLPDGGFVVTWRSYNTETTYDVHAQIYDSDGSTRGSEFQVNTYANNTQHPDSVTSLADGGFVITWSSRDQDGSGYGTYGQRYNADGSMSGDEFQVNTYTNNNQAGSHISGLSDGGFVIAWSSLGDGSGFGIYGQLYNADGEANGDEFRINTHTINEQDSLSLTNLADGGFVVTWCSREQDGSGGGIYGQRYNADGEANGDEFQINTYTEDWQSNSSVTSLIDGGFVVTWSSYEQDGSSYGIYGQRYNADGTMNGDEFQINTYTDNSQNYPSVTGLADGGFIVTWDSLHQDGDSFGVYGQRYNADGESVEPSVNFEPIAQDDTFSGFEDEVIIGNVLADNGYGEDSDADGDALTVQAATITTVNGGSVVLNADGTFTYTPAIGFSGTDSFDYTLTDGYLTDTASVNLVVTEAEVLGLVTIEAEDISFYGDVYLQDVTPDNFEVLNGDVLPLRGSALKAMELSSEALESGDTLHLWGNTWKSMEFSYTVTEDTVLEFDFRSTSQGEIHGIGLGSDLTVDAASDPNFELFGTDNWLANRIDDYDIGDGWKHYTINVGDYYIGDVNYLTFINDHDVADPTANSYFRDIQVYESSGLITIDVADIRSHGDVYLQDVTPDNFEVLDNGDTLHLWGNTWKSMEFSYTVTEGTVLEFDFRSTSQGEIQGIGLGSDLTVDAASDPNFELFGTDNWLANRIDDYDIGDGWKHYTINIGDDYIGDVNYLTFINDHDVADPTANSYFRDIQVYDDGIKGTSGRDDLHGSSVENVLYSYDGNDILHGYGSTDAMYGGDGSDYLYGGSGDDVLYGGDGVDMLFGQGGADMLYGQGGADTFVFEAGSAFTSSDNIQDFSFTEGDKLDISDILSGYDPQNDVIANFVQVTESEGNSYLSVDADGGADNFVQIACICGITDFADVEEMEASGNLITV